MNSRSSLKDKKIVLGVTGSIAAYKAADLIRRLREKETQVRVVMTKSACEFITPLTLQTLSGHPVAIELLDADEEAAMGHIKLARWADWILIAPATADTIAKLVHGRANDLLTAMCSASESPLAIAPAMNNKMWQNRATQDNIRQLRSQSVQILGPASGDQACGEQGEGRLLEPNEIVKTLEQLAVPARFKGKHVVVTAGPTHEPIDPVRYIGNRSSGKMGYAVATAAAEAGADVTIVSGPVHIPVPSGVECIHVETARQMHGEVMKRVKNCDVFIACAAVADFRPQQVETQKIKKTKRSDLQIQLVATKDIVADVAQTESPPFIVGFAAETEDIVDYAKDKLHRKKLDMIAANQVGNGLGFAVEDNELQVFWQNGSHILSRAPKRQLARDLMTLIIEQYNAKNTT